MTICHSTDSTFKSDLQNDGFTLVNFWAPWCGPCRAFAPILEGFDQEYRKSVRVLKVNVDEHPDISSHYGVMSLPTTILFKDGEPIDKMIGAVPIDKLKQFIINKMN
ncbi:thioredoxin [Paenibacillus sp. ACRRX]|uniref:thioredoxin n=1 Tax=unclassified Paenibacillus TaxID=185978 RepID=UPI001EF62740|nr:MULTISPECIES: thioredoxin [unclassified Paenibacillus]MCG7407104.1 thioredoxin [Paenibacillus sp. ACRRX]MDK8180324.1 thioredoxin [Paenibacillus sp. UMB4589-SE434]